MFCHADCIQPLTVPPVFEKVPWPYIKRSDSFRDNHKNLRGRSCRDITSGDAAWIEDESASEVDGHMSPLGIRTWSDAATYSCMGRLVNQVLVPEYIMILAHETWSPTSKSSPGNATRLNKILILTSFNSYLQIFNKMRKCSYFISYAKLEYAH